jgi:hypothetical protein
MADTLSTCAAARGFIEMQHELPIGIGGEPPFGASFELERDIQMVQFVRTAVGVATAPLITGAFDGLDEPHVASSRD